MTDAFQRPETDRQIASTRLRLARRSASSQARIGNTNARDGRRSHERPKTGPDRARAAMHAAWDAGRFAGWGGTRDVPIYRGVALRVANGYAPMAYAYPFGAVIHGKTRRFRTVDDARGLIVADVNRGA